MSGELERIRRTIGLSVESLWVAAFGLGSMLTMVQLENVLLGSDELNERELRILATALNEACADAGCEDRVPA